MRPASISALGTQAIVDMHHFIEANPKFDVLNAMLSQVRMSRKPNCCPTCCGVAIPPFTTRDAYTNGYGVDAYGFFRR